MLKKYMFPCTLTKLLNLQIATLLSAHRGTCEIICELASSNSVFLLSVHFLDIPLLINLYAAKPTIALNIVN